jgi:PAS domain S-box-containing protein
LELVMKRNATEVSSWEELRRRAEVSPPGPSPGEETPDLSRLVHELEVHRFELQVQNEELQATSLELEKNRDRYFEIYDLAPVGYLNLDLEGRILEANHAAVAIAGLDRQHLIGRTVPSLMSAPDADTFYLHCREALGRRAPVHCDVALHAGGGGQTPVHMSSKVLRDAAGKPEGFLCVLFDLSDLRRTEQQLLVQEWRVRESEARLREIAEHVEDALVLREADGTFSYVSPAYQRIWARPPQEILDNSVVWMDAVHPEDRARLARAEVRLAGGAAFEETYRIRRPEGEVRWVRSRFFPFAGRPGQRTRTVGIVQDVTSARALEEELRQAQKMEAMGTMASAIAHDFGNLLQGIMGCAAVALASDDIAVRRSYLNGVLDAVKRGSDLVGQLTAFSRKRTTDRRPTGVDALVAGLATLLERLLGEHIRLELRPGAPGALVSADRVQLEQILLNLAANARDAMPEGGTLTIETEELGLAEDGGGIPPGRQLRLLVRDTGVGMDDRTKARIFEPFFTTKPPGFGTGMGLSTVLGITQNLGGRVEVASESGRGTSFVFHFPCSDAEPAVAPPLGGELRFHGRALLIEDHGLVRMTVRHYLEELGLEVVEASAAAEALKIAETGSAIDLCVSDVTLPGASGPKLVTQLRERYPGLSALFISAHPTGELVARGTLEATAVALQKPFGKEELAAKLAALLPAPANP